MPVMIVTLINSLILVFVSDIILLTMFFHSSHNVIKNTIFSLLNALWLNNFLI